ncbi:MAG: serine hydrolase [Proteobacteria bacterium]|nr:serine hydrolase [Pseudomonadota bacterium]
MPSQLEGHLVRVMDDLATAERSRWEVWHEVRHGRLPLAKLVQIAHEELHFIRKNEMHAAKIVQVKWDARTAGWYPIAFRIMLQLMSQAHPVEFASELLLPFTVESVRSHPDPWSKMMSLDRNKFRLDPKVERLNYFFEKCGCLSFAEQIANESILDLAKLEAMIMNFSLEEIKEAARFHGDIGEDSSKLDAHAMQEQALLKNSEQLILQELRELGSSYQAKFGFKFLISAKDKKADYLLAQLKLRLLNSRDQEIFLAKEALWQISKKRILAQPLDEHLQAIKALMTKHQITGAAIALASDRGVQEISLGFAEKDKRPVHNHTFFELASLSKTLASAFAIEYFNKKGIPLDTSVNRLLAKTSSNFRLRLAKEKEWLDEVNIEQILNHTALNMHYVKGFSRDKAMPPLTELLLYPERYGYSAIEVLHKPGTVFQYSGGGYLVLEHLIEAIEGKSIQELIRPFLRALGNLDLSFEAESFMGKDYANGYFDNGEGLAAGYLIFPAFAAGAFGTAGAMLSFLGLLGQAYHSLEGAGPISHDTAVRMLQGIDKGARKFMGCRIGLGVFIAEAGANRLAIHQ